MIGLGPPTLRMRDTIYVLFGCNLPVVLREQDSILNGLELLMCTARWMEKQYRDLEKTRRRFEILS